MEISKEIIVSILVKLDTNDLIEASQIIIENDIYAEDLCLNMQIYFESQPEIGFDIFTIMMKIVMAIEIATESRSRFVS